MMDRQTTNTWAIILAGGEGVRLQEYIRSRFGSETPKQFASIIGSRSMLRHTLERVKLLIPLKHIRIVVCRHHLQFVQAQLNERERRSLVVLPSNRETALSVLVPCMQIAAQDPEGTVVLFPSDHFIGEEERFMEYVHQGVQFLDLRPESLVLFGIPPTDAATEYGWIEPAEHFVKYGGNRYFKVIRFVEKPSTSVARVLMEGNALWNSMVVAARVAALLALYHRSLPVLHKHVSELKGLLDPEEAAPDRDAVLAALPSHSFCKCILEPNTRHLVVVRVEGADWSDWGTAERVMHDIEKLGMS